MLRRAFFIVLVFGLAGVIGSAAPGRFSLRAVAQTSPPPFSCFFAGLNQYNNLISSGIPCFTPAPAPSGQFSQLVCSGLVTCAPSGAPSPSVVVAAPVPTATGCGTWSWAWPNVSLNTTGCATQATPSPSASSTGCGSLSWSGSWPYTINGNFSSCGGGSTGATLYTPLPMPSAGVATAQPGYLSVGGIAIGEPTSVPTQWPQAIQLMTDQTVCGSGGNEGYVSIGTDTVSYPLGTGVYGQLFRIGCYAITPGSDSFTAFTIDSFGDAGVKGSVFTGPGVGAGVVLQTSGGVTFPNSSTAVDPCLLRDFDTIPAVALVHTTGGTCTFALPDVAGGSNLCTSSASGHPIVACPTTTGSSVYQQAVTTASSCTAFVSCGTVNFSFPNTYGAAPYCGAAGVQDTTTSTQMWATGITAVSTTSITLSYSPLVTTAGAHSLVLTFPCGPA